MKMSEHTESPEHSARIRDNKVRVAGLNFRIDNFNAFIEEAKKLEMGRDTIGLRLIQDTDNDYDPNAIKVMGYTKAKDDASSSSSFHIGFLPKMIASKLKDDGLKAVQLFAELTDLVDKPPKAILDLYKI